MTRDEAFVLVRNGFKDEPDEDGGWWSKDDGEIYEGLLTRLIDTHGLSPEAAYDILGAAHYATCNEYGE